MPVYRFEHITDNKGPYRYRDIHTRECEKMLRSHCAYIGPGSEHPSIEAENSSYSINHDVDLFGFVSIEQMNRWFKPCEQLILFNSGYRLRRYDTCAVEIRVVTKSQCVFRFKKSEAQIKQEKLAKQLARLINGRVARIRYAEKLWREDKVRQWTAKQFADTLENQWITEQYDSVCYENWIRKYEKVYF
ncbi:hypothetical protein U27_02618 [Candidatus Vecturithrix granuli]|uniref:Uncharacterized protein n=1 Tax=Vecturithrix granuli TaxID=1499967 RepID=A0A081CB30_VECG1|nr:hypothetical protein U27_02618 [Candidatus Vecturithrix granuli]